MGLLSADQGKLWVKLYHASSIALAGLVPAGVVLDSNKAVDYGLAVVAPLHGHCAMNYVISDYVPLGARGAARFGMLGVTAVAAAGLLKLTRDGPGPTAALKSLWKK